jgi:membrane-associated protease RseP (regulator of RpoE activity)
MSGARDSEMLLVLANMGFLLNAFNLLPIGFLDGGQTMHAAHEAWRMPVIRFEGGIPVQAFAPDRSRAVTIAALYALLALLLVLGMLATRLDGQLL